MCLSQIAKHKVLICMIARIQYPTIVTMYVTQ